MSTWVLEFTTVMGQRFAGELLQVCLWFCSEVAFSRVVLAADCSWIFGKNDLGVAKTYARSLFNR